MNYTTQMDAARKGIITDEELNTTRIEATQLVDQIWAKQKEEAIKEFDEQHPGVRKLFGNILGDINGQ